MVYGLWSSENVLFSSHVIGGIGWTLQKGTRSGLWRTGKRLYGLMKLKLTGWGQMEGNGSEKRLGSS
jgi:hypothetical protein